MLKGRFDLFNEKPIKWKSLFQKSIKLLSTVQKTTNCYSCTLQLIVYCNNRFHLVDFWNTHCNYLIDFLLEGSDCANQAYKDFILPTLEWLYLWCETPRSTLHLLMRISDFKPLRLGTGLNYVKKNVLSLCCRSTRLMLSLIPLTSLQ